MKPTPNIAKFVAAPTSANLLDALPDKTGTGALVFNTDASLTGTTIIEKAVLAGPINQKWGTDIASVAIGSAITLPGDGDKYHITGSLNLNYITYTGIQDGYEVQFMFRGAVDMVNNRGSVPANSYPIRLPGGSNFTTAVNHICTLTLDAGDGLWRMWNHSS